jgi:chromosome segregation ATPase
VKQLFADLPDEDRRQIAKLSIKLAQVAEEKSKLQVQVVGLTQQNALLQRENEGVRAEADRAIEEVKKHNNTIRSLHSKVEHYKAYIEDTKSERKALLEEKDNSLKEMANLKRFLPEFEQIERHANKRKYLIEMRERCSHDELNGFLY